MFYLWIGRCGCRDATRQDRVRHNESVGTASHRLNRTCSELTACVYVFCAYHCNSTTVARIRAMAYDDSRKYKGRRWREFHVKRRKRLVQTLCLYCTHTHIRTHRTTIFSNTFNATRNAFVCVTFRPVQVTRTTRHARVGHL